MIILFSKNTKTNHIKFEEILNLCKNKKMFNNGHGCGTIQPTRYYEKRWRSMLNGNLVTKREKRFIKAK